MLDSLTTHKILFEASQFLLMLTTFRKDFLFLFVIYFFHPQVSLLYINQSDQSYLFILRNPLNNLEIDRDRNRLFRVYNIEQYLKMGNSKSLYSKGDQLYFYIEKNDIANILKLLDSNPQLLNNPLTKDTKHTAILRTSFNGNIELARLLVQRKADLNYVTPKGETSLTIAIKRNHYQVVKLLVENGADLGHISKASLRVIEYAILPGFYDIASLIFSKLTDKQKMELQDPQSYAELGKKHAYRYVNYNQFLQGLVSGQSLEDLPDFLKKQKVKLEDPVVDPRETWKQWLKRQIQWKDAPLIERNSLPQNLQPQNRVFGKLHHYTNNFMSTHLSQKTSLYPENRECMSQLGEINKKRGQALTQQKMNVEMRSQI